MPTEADTCRTLITPVLHVLRVPPIADHGQPGEIIQFFGGADQLHNAVNQLSDERQRNTTVEYEG